MQTFAQPLNYSVNTVSRRVQNLFNNWIDFLVSLARKSIVRASDIVAAKVSYYGDTEHLAICKSGRAG